jgi:hypothetical protein
LYDSESDAISSFWWFESVRYDNLTKNFNHKYRLLAIF